MNVQLATLIVGELQLAFAVALKPRVHLLRMCPVSHYHDGGILANGL
jgi:hypothetical protein